MKTSELEAAERVGRLYSTPRRVIFVVNSSRSFWAHRGTWAAAYRAGGSSVLLLTCDDGDTDKLRAAGITVRLTTLGREDTTWGQALRASAHVLATIVRFRPDVVFLSATAAYTLGWHAAIIRRRTLFLRIVAGRGRALSGTDRRGVQNLVSSQLRISARCQNMMSIFQTDDDAKYFASRGFARQGGYVTVAGAGVDVDTWFPRSEPRDGRRRTRVIFASRLFREKGFFDFIDIARGFAGDDGVAFTVAGEPDRGVRTSVTEAQLQEYVGEGLIEYLGHCDDMTEVLSSSDVLVFPSSHPEGTPKILIEAAACGLPVVAYDQPGCRAVVDDRQTGLLVEMHRVDQMKEAVECLVHDRALRASLAAAARSKAVAEFSLETVLKRILPVTGARPRQTTRTSIGGESQ